ncbi:MAG: MATE family efflux transporter [Planctomycetota bacterium]|nr:MATE family efflux transporter [Planctomycetota bacterium]MDP6940869.1 MATE family efflux transporter [Planctomycetota bacterium]
MNSTTIPPANYAGSIREIMHISWPIWVSMISLTLKGVVDTIMIGHLGTDALAGVGFAGVLVFNVLCFGMGVLRGQKSLVSQYLGAGERKTAFYFGVQAFWIGLLFSVLCVFAGLWQETWFLSIANKANLSESSLDMGRRYFDTRLVWAGAFLLQIAVSEYLRGTGRTRLPMAADLISQPLNVLFNYALIFGKFGAPELGVEGAAIGTGLADLASLILLLGFGRAKVSLEDLKLQPKRWWRALRVGTAGGIQFTIEVGAYTLLTFFIGFISTQDLAAHNAAISILHFSFMSAVALGDGGSVLIGRYVGSLDWELARKTLRNMLGLMIVVMVVMGALFVTFGREIMLLYIADPDPEVMERTIRLGIRLLWVAAVFQIGDAIQIAFRFSLRAAGDHTWVMWAGILCSWLLTVPLAATAVFLMKGDAATVWWMWNFEIYLGGFFFYRRWRSGAWQAKRLVQDRGIVARPESPLEGSL